MNGQALIDLFDILTDGLSELTAANKLALANRKYKKLANEREWEDLRTSATYTIASNQIVLPQYFNKFVPNDTFEEEGFAHVFFIGTTPHPIMRFAERKRFSNLSYFDPSLGTYGKIITPSSLEGQLAEYDYYRKVADLTVSTSPLFRNSDNHSIIAYMMAVEHYSIDQSENGRSKEEQYQNTVDEMMEDMEYDDSKAKEAGAPYA